MDNSSLATRMKDYESVSKTRFVVVKHFCNTCG